MAIKQQRLHSVLYKELKNLRDVEIDFEDKNVTGIFGVNGCGKSTIIHSLLCLYKPTDEDVDRINYKFSHYFTPTSLSKWIGSQFEITYSFRDGEAVSSRVLRTYTKADRWKPRYGGRPPRNIYFIGINTCVPEIEVEKATSMIRLNSELLNDQISILIKRKAEYILNKLYNEYSDYTRLRKHYIGVKSNGISYSSLSMGAGEQRIFKILNVVFKAPAYSLIIIDEIDLTLHTDALNRLLNVLVERANEKKHQIIFTSHREEITKRNDINVRHIHQTENKTLCFNQTTPDCINRLTGTSERTLELFVEDDLSSAIVKRIIDQLEIRRHCSIKKFGAIDNSFSLSMGMLLKGENLSKMLIILDGDKYKTEEERLFQIKKKFSGTEADADDKRNYAISIIKQFILPDNCSPEKYINNQLCSINDGTEIVEQAKLINGVLDEHDHVNTIIKSLGYGNCNEGLSGIIQKLSESPDWNNYISEVKNWLTVKIEEFHLH